ncbi:Calponin homology (CH) domain containing protein, putative [Trypanosoma equiperdum]|uniref:Calponin homology (CH) domain containing protein, putative n=1 Tax=Trypanosoma equiperdum TaxID=5694 RepID=A0A1G4IIL3_TRYEQ|nr:Calponin homology (CH) domain containing protein, putative [Trypanosoma equiperdum]
MVSRAKHPCSSSLPPIVFPSGPSATYAAFSQKEDAALDARNKIERHRYAKLLLEYAERYREFSSVSFFVETMLRELAGREGVTNQSRAMAAVWSMKLLSCHSPFKQFMVHITEALLPAIFCNYDAKRLDYAPAAIQALLCDRALHRDNPFFSHSTYMHEYDASLLKLKNISGELKRVSFTGSEWKRIAHMLVVYVQSERKRRAFIAWRDNVKKERVVNKLRRNVVSRHGADSRFLCVALGFLRWKSATAMSRVQFLTERLHDAAFQLESAKNQFHMECFRADKLQLSNEEKDSELKAVMCERDELQLEVERLKEQLKIQERNHEANLRARLLEILTLAQHQNILLKKIVGTQFDAKEVVAGWLHKEDGDYQEREPEHGENEALQGHSFLLRWCNHILRSGEVGVLRRVRNFADDFADGEVFHGIIRYVFPEKKEFATSVDSSVADRLRLVCDFTTNIPLAVSLTVEDFNMKREDRIIVAVAEIFAYYVEKKRADAVSESFRLVVEQDPLQVDSSIATDSEDVSLLTTEEDVKKQLSIWNKELSKQVENFRLGVWCEMDLQKSGMCISREAARLTWERGRGHPRYVVTAAPSRHFVSLNARKMNDLREKFGSCTPQVWRSVVQSLKRVLWKHVNTITSIFYHYAGENAHEMDEVQFWRFVEDSRLMVEPLSRQTIARIFDTVISPKLMAMLQAKSVEKQAALLEAAEEEMNIRRVKPAQFTEILLHMGAVRFRDSLLDAAGRFLTGLSVPTLCGVTPTTVDFYRPESQRVIRHLQEDLARVFFFYVKQQSENQRKSSKGLKQPSGRFVGRISFDAYLRMFSDCGFVADNKEKENNSRRGSTEPHRYCRKVKFTDVEEITETFNALHERVLLLPEGELCFSLFLESFGIACQYWCPDPKVSFPRKLACFLTDMIERLRTLHSRSALILRELPPPTVEKGDAGCVP